MQSVEKVFVRGAQDWERVCQSEVTGRRTTGAEVLGVPRDSTGEAMIATSASLLHELIALSQICM